MLGMSDVRMPTSKAYPSWEKGTGASRKLVDLQNKQHVLVGSHFACMSPKPMWPPSGFGLVGLHAREGIWMFSRLLDQDQIGTMLCSARSHSIEGGL